MTKAFLLTQVLSSVHAPEIRGLVSDVTKLPKTDKAAAPCCIIKARVFLTPRLRSSMLDQFQTKTEKTREKEDDLNG